MIKNLTNDQFNQPLLKKLRDLMTKHANRFILNKQIIYVQVCAGRSLEMSPNYFLRDKKIRCKGVKFDCLSIEGQDDLIFRL